MAKNEEVNEVEDTKDSIYEEDNRADLIDDDAISSTEEGFMKGYDESEEEKKAEEDTEEESDDEGL